MPEATELLDSNLREVFSERDPERRWAAIGRTSTEDVTFIDPDGEFVGWQALSDRAQELLDQASAGDVFEEDGPRTLAPTRPHWPGASGPLASQSLEGSISLRSKTVA
jgi:hypothetical protein